MKVVTFGEVMLRLATPGHLRLNQTSVLEMTFGGGEANVAVSLALFGEEAAFVTRLPKNDVAEACIQQPARTRRRHAARSCAAASASGFTSWKAALPSALRP